MITISYYGKEGSYFTDSMGLPKPYTQVVRADGISAILFEGGTGNDHFDASGVTSIPVIMNGGEGADRLTGGQKKNRFIMSGQDIGNDQLTGTAASENIIDFSRQKESGLALVFQREENREVLKINEQHHLNWKGGKIDQIKLTALQDVVEIKDFSQPSLMLVDVGGDDHYKIHFNQNGSSGKITIVDAFGKSNKVTAVADGGSSPLKLSNGIMQLGDQRVLFSFGDTASEENLREVIRVFDGEGNELKWKFDLSRLKVVFYRQDGEEVSGSDLFFETSIAETPETLNLSHLEIESRGSADQPLEVVAHEGESADGEKLVMDQATLKLSGDSISLDLEIEAACLELAATGKTTLSNKITIERTVDGNGGFFCLNNGAILSAKEMNLTFTELIEIMAEAELTATGAIVLQVKEGNIAQLGGIIRAQSLSATAERGNILLSTMQAEERANILVAGSISQQGGLITARELEMRAGQNISLKDLAIETLTHLKAEQGSITQGDGTLLAEELIAEAGEEIILDKVALTRVSLEAGGLVQLREQDDLVVTYSRSNRFDLEIEQAGDIELREVIARNGPLSALIKAKTADGDLLVGLVDSEKELELYINGKIVENSEDSAADLVAERAAIFHKSQFKLQTALSELALLKYGKTSVDFTNMGDLLITRLQGDKVIPYPQVPTGDEIVDYSGIAGVANQSALSTYRIGVEGNLTLQGFENHARTFRTDITGDLVLDTDLSSHRVDHFVGGKVTTVADRTYNSERHYYKATDAELSGNFTGVVSDFTLDYTREATIDIASLTTDRFVAQYGSSLHVVQLSGSL